MRISDWSSDVCSSDLLAFGRRDVIVEQQVAHRARRRGDRLDVLHRRFSHCGSGQHDITLGATDVTDMEAVPLTFTGGKQAGVQGIRIVAVDQIDTLDAEVARKSTRLNSSHY